MKLRKSDMPDEAYWETLFDIPLILDRLGVDANVGDVVELGCGYGTFTVPVARRVSGTLRTCDIDPAMVERTARRAAALGVHNIVCEQRDVLMDGFGVGPESQDVRETSTAKSSARSFEAWTADVQPAPVSSPHEATSALLPARRSNWSIRCIC